jgi:hypothetical protein
MISLQRGQTSIKPTNRHYSYSDQNNTEKNKKDQANWFIKMPSFNPLFSLPIVFLSMLIVFLNLTTRVAAQTYLNHSCEDSTVAQNSIYSSNINSLLSSLSSNATGSIEFYNTTPAKPPPAPYTVSSTAVEMSTLTCAEDACSTQPKNSQVRVQRRKLLLLGTKSAWCATPTSLSSPPWP